MTYPALTVITFLPLLGAAGILLLGRGQRARWIALATTLATLAVMAPLCSGFDKTNSGLQFVDSVAWISMGNIQINYQLGVDGISLPFIVLSGLLTLLCVGTSWTAIRTRDQEFYAALLLAETAMIGLFAAANFFLFFVFWELMVVPLFLLIGIWGGSNRIYAAVKFLLFTLAGSVLMLVGMITLQVINPEAGLNFKELEGTAFGPTTQIWLFLAFLAAFAVKVPMFPVHTWLPDAHTEAPTAGSVILAGVLLKLGIYGFIRFAIPFFPEAAATATPWISILAIIGIIFGALMCFVQEDMKRLIAYSSVSHMGFIVLGLFAFNSQGVQGSVLQMVNHGISTGALFLLIGCIYERRHTRRIIDFGGLAPTAPKLAIIFFITTLSSIGLPFLNGFIGEFLILQGAYSRNVYYAAFAGLGIILGAVYMLTLYRRIFFGETDREENAEMKDLNGRELAFLMPLVGLMVLLGLFSPWFTSKIEPSILRWLELVKAGGG